MKEQKNVMQEKTRRKAKEARKVNVKKEKK
jgi:hypothetical protein